MISRFAEILSRQAGTGRDSSGQSALTGPIAREIAEALWLAESLPAGMLSPAAALRHAAVARGTPDVAAFDRAASQDQPAGAGYGSQPGYSARLPAGAVGGAPGAAGLGVQVHGVPALPGSANLTRALRPLNRRFPSAAKTVLDEDETAARIADGGVWSPHYRPLMDRWLDLTLLVDVSTSMRLWRQTVGEFRTVLDRLGAFRDLRSWQFDGDDPAPELQLNGESDIATHTLAELADPAGRRAVLVLSDCIGAAWSNGAVSSALAALSKTAPVAVLQMLPERLWHRSGQLYTPVTFRASSPAQPTARVLWLPRLPVSFPPEPGVAIPVLELTADGRWLASWAGLIAGAGKSAGMALHTGLMTGAREYSREPITSPRPGARDLVLEFREHASPGAYALAGYLAAAPLSLSVMRLVQAVMLPRSRPADLAEVVLSALVQAADAPDGQTGEGDYEFGAGVREQLLAGLPRGETVRVLDEVGRFLTARRAPGPDFTAILDVGADGIMAAGLPFAHVACTALRAVGGYYAEVAAKLEQRLEDDAGRPSPPAGETWPSTAALREGDSQTPVQESATPSPQELMPEQVTPLAIPPVTALDPGDDVTQPTPAARAARDRPAIPLGWASVPRRNPNFTGREALLLDLRAQLSNSVTALVPHALHGLGGVGKTQLAIEYAYRFKSEYDVVWWIPAEQEETIAIRLADLADVLSLPRYENVGDTVANVLEHLGRADASYRWLLIYDNAGDPDKVIKYLPAAVGDILITSLNQEWIDEAYAIRVGVFSRAESVELISRRGRGITADDADRLAERLGDLPLALEQAATWQRQTGMSVAEYLAQLDKQHQKLLTAASAAGPTKHVAEAWGVALNRLIEENPAAAQLLQLCAFFGPEPISIEILHHSKNVTGIPEALRAAADDGIGLHSAIRQIGRYGLAEVEAEERLRVHRLVQAVLRDRLPADEQTAYRRFVHLVLADANPGDPDNNFNWHLLEQISQHVVRSTALIEGSGDNVRHLVLDQIRYRYVRGNFERSRDLADTTIRLWRESYGDDDKLLLIASRHLGNALRGIGRYPEALEVDRVTLERMRHALGEDDEHTLLAASSYGADLRLAGDYGAALALDELTLSRRRALYGNESRITLRCQNNLAVDLRLVGDFKGALEQDQRILALRTSVLGADDQDTLFAQCMVARDLRGCGDYLGALDLYRQVLPSVRALLDDHEDVLNTRLSYGLTLLRTGYYDQAMAEIEEVLAIFQTRFGTTHPGVIRAMTMLASPARLLGNRGRAHDLAEQALRLATRLYGKDHIFTALYASNRAITWRGLGRYDAACQADEEILPRIRAALGDDHLFTLSSTANLATDLGQLANASRARQLSTEAYERSLIARGTENPLTLACGYNLALDMIATGDQVDGEELRARSVRQLGDILGSRSQVVVDLEAGQRYEFDIEPPRV